MKFLAHLSVEQAHFSVSANDICQKKIFSLAPSFETGVTMAVLRLIAFQKKSLNSSETTDSKPVGG